MSNEIIGYSKKTLVQKLGIKNGRIFFSNPPQNYEQTLETLPTSVTVVCKLEDNLQFIHHFTQSKSELEKLFPILKNALAKNGMLWISWPKLSAKIPSDLNENIIRNIGLHYGLVDVKVCAIDVVWSGLKFVYRLTDRGVI